MGIYIKNVCQENLRLKSQVWKKSSGKRYVQPDGDTPSNENSETFRAKITTRSSSHMINSRLIKGLNV